MYTLCMDNIFYGWYIWIYIKKNLLDTHIRFYSIEQVTHSIATVPWMWHSITGSARVHAAPQHASHANIFCKKRFFIKAHCVHFPHEPGHPLSPNPNIVIVQLLLLGNRHLLNLRALRHEACEKREATKTASACKYINIYVYIYM